MTGITDPKATEDMKRLIALMNENVTFDDHVSAPPAYDYYDYADTAASPSAYDYPVSPAIPSSGVAPPLPISTPDVEDMKRILQLFNSASAESPAARLNDRATKNRELRHALVTENTTKGTRIGSWEIVINEGLHGLKTFDVTSVHTGEAIAGDLTLYDAAHGIVSHLNEGGTINSRVVREILNTEASYAANRQDAATFKVRCEQATSSSRKAIMEDRYFDALEKTKAARIKLTDLVRRI